MTRIDGPGKLIDIGSFARVVSYDRAGYGWSALAGRDRSGGRVVGDLHLLLQRSNIPGPYILVGHSLGGLYTRLFAARYPSEVVGMVLVGAQAASPSLRAWNPSLGCTA